MIIFTCLGLFAAVDGGKCGSGQDGQDGEEKRLRIPPQQREGPHEGKVEKWPSKPHRHGEVVGQVDLFIGVVHH